MSTRATYQFKKPSYRTTVTYYIHHDGYPEGAAYYFLKTIHSQSADPHPHQTFAEDFIRANDRARVTASHELHGDTEYRYTYDCDTGKLKAMSLVDFDTGKFKTFFNGPLEEFINKYPEFCATLYPGKQFIPLVIPVAA